MGGFVYMPVCVSGIGIVDNVMIPVLVSVDQYGGQIH